jgi:anti-sigma factor (TIGR02949 family)
MKSDGSTDDPMERGECGGEDCPRSSCLQLFLDGELEPTPSSEIEAHLAACAGCAERASLLAAMKASVRRRCAVRATDALRAKICLAVARESAPGESAAVTGGQAQGAESVAAQFGAAPSRESLLAEDRGERAQRSARVAYGVGALALAAGVALAVVGERVAIPGAPSTSGDAETARVTDGGRSGDGRVQDGRDPSGMPAGVGLPGGGLMPPLPQHAAPTGPALAPSAIAGRDERPTFDAVLDDLVAEHMNPLPPEERDLAKLRRFEPVVGVAMRAPTLRKYDARFRGARVLPMRGAQRTAMLQYELPDGERVTVYLWNPQAVPIGSTRLHPRILRDDAPRGDGARPDARAEGSVRLRDALRDDAAPIYVGEARGVSVAACERRGVGYALATKRDADESVRMVATSVP